MRSLSVAFAVGLLVAGLAPTPACAATASASFSVSATVVSSCQATPHLSAANGTPAFALANAASSVAIACTLPTPYTIAARAVTVSAAGTENHKAPVPGTDFLPSHSRDTNNANEQTLPPVPHTEAIMVTVSY